MHCQHSVKQQRQPHSQKGLTWWLCWLCAGLSTCARLPTQLLLLGFHCWQSASGLTEAELAASGAQPVAFKGGQRKTRCAHCALRWLALRAAACKCAPVAALVCISLLRLCASASGFALLQQRAEHSNSLLGWTLNWVGVCSGGHVWIEPASAIATIYSLALADAATAGANATAKAAALPAVAVVATHR